MIDEVRAAFPVVEDDEIARALDAGVGQINAESYEEVARIDNVRSVETFVVYKSFNLRVPLTGQPVLEPPADCR